MYRYAAAACAALWWRNAIRDLLTGRGLATRNRHIKQLPYHVCDTIRRITHTLRRISKPGFSTTEAERCISGISMRSFQSHHFRYECTPPESKNWVLSELHPGCVLSYHTCLRQRFRDSPKKVTKISETCGLVNSLCIHVSTHKYE